MMGAWKKGKAGTYVCQSSSFARSLYMGRMYGCIARLNLHRLRDTVVYFYQKGKGTNVMLQPVTESGRVGTRD